MHFRRTGRLRCHFPSSVLPAVIPVLCSGRETLLPLRVFGDLIIALWCPRLQELVSVEVCLFCFGGLRKILDFHFRRI